MPRNSKMGHQIGTPAELQKVPGHTRLHRRGCRYYIRAKVPVDLQKSLGRMEYKKALKTSDFREAIRLIKFESAKLDALFDKERERVHRGAQGKRPLSAMAAATELRA